MTQYIGRWPSTVVRWRALTWAEFDKFFALLQYRPHGLQASVYAAVVLEGPALERCPAGIVHFIADQVLLQSPFRGDPVAITQALGRARASTTYLDNIQAILANLLHCSFAEMQQWDSETLFKRVSQAESILGNPLNPAAPGNKAKASDKKATRGLTPAQQEIVRRHRNSQ